MKGTNTLGKGFLKELEAEAAQRSTTSDRRPRNNLPVPSIYGPSADERGF